MSSYYDHVDINHSRQQMSMCNRLWDKKKNRTRHWFTRDKITKRIVQVYADFHVQCIQIETFETYVQTFMR
jgi:hypothetical protein